MPDYQWVKRKPLVDIVKVGKRGEIVLPRRLLKTFGLQEGDELVLSVDDRRVVLERRARHFGAYLDVISTSTGGEGDDD